MRGSKSTVDFFFFWGGGGDSSAIIYCKDFYTRLLLIQIAGFFYLKITINKTH